MNTTARRTSFAFNLTQIAWVVKDITVAQRFFREALGIGNLSKAEITRFEEFKGIFYGEPCDAESLVSIAYSGGTFIIERWSDKFFFDSKR